MRDGDDGVIYTGVLVSWNARGFGFIRPAGGGRDNDVFIHASKLADSARVPGARLRFGLTHTAKGRQAVWAALIDDEGAHP
jgi:cold shock CspA family protein